MKNIYDLIGVGIGPFNLSLAALIQKNKKLKTLFFDAKPEFSWHPEVMFEDSVMQTTYMKDLVAPADPTSPYSFLNYLHNEGLFYQFLNTQRSVVTRKEFEKYCKWVSAQLAENLRFLTPIQSVDFKEGSFEITTSQKETYFSQNICVATGKRTFVPESCQRHTGPNMFHIKDFQAQSMNLNNKKVVIIGGGQTGIEVFKNALDGKWGQFQSLSLYSRRKNLEPLDETAFTNDYFTPNYVQEFWGQNQKIKDQIVCQQKLSSDGNTPSYLQDLYQKLYQVKNIKQDKRSINVLPMRNLNKVYDQDRGYLLNFENTFTQKEEIKKADIVVLCTGFEASIPPVLEPLFDKIKFDDQGRFRFNKSYSLKWEGQETNKIYALNYSRHSHGIVDPQTSMMAWRSANIVNDLSQNQIYKTNGSPSPFLRYTEVKDNEAAMVKDDEAFISSNNSSYNIENEVLHDL